MHVLIYEAVLIIDVSSGRTEAAERAECFTQSEQIIDESEWSYYY